MARSIPSPQTTCPSPTATDQGATHRLTIKQAPTRGAASRPPRDHVQARNETTTSNTDFPAQQSRKVTTQPTRFVLYPGLRSDARGASDERAGRPRAPERRVRRAGGKAPRPGAARATSGREDPAPRGGAPRRKRGPRTIGARPPPSSSTTIRWEVGLGQAPPW